MSRFLRRIHVRFVRLLLLLCFCAYFYGKMSIVRPSYLLDQLNIDCTGILSNDRSTIDFYQHWEYNVTYAETEILRSTDRCSAIKSRFHFRSTPLSLEEKEYPLAYGLIVYKNFVQVLFMLSSFYHPQNVYTMIVPQNAAPEFRLVMKQLDGCVPNVHVIEFADIRWGSHEILAALYTAFNFNTQLKHSWKYFQYLSGVDVPLKTNLEMVRIFKALNGTMNFEIGTYQRRRLKGRKHEEPPLKLFKSSMSALVPRAVAERTVKSEKVDVLLEFLNGTRTPDESFWATIGGIPDLLPLGQPDAGKLLALKEEFNETYASLAKRGIKQTVPVLGDPDYCSFSSPCQNYISRFQIWSKKDCKGKMKKGSCLFGIGDLPTLFNRPELVAHKLYIDHEPAAFFCLLKAVNHRALHPIPFDASEYTRIPSVELKSGKTVEQLTYPEKMFGGLFPRRL